MAQAIEKRLSTKATRVAAAIKVCEHQDYTALDALLTAIDKMSWAEIGELTPYLSLLGSRAVPDLCALLTSTRKQTIEAITTALGDIGDGRAASPLVNLMEAQVGQANAIRGRDALIHLGVRAVPALLAALESPQWEVRYHAVQALAVIGDRDAIPELAILADEDRSSKVREAADEAIQLIPSVDEDEMYHPQHGFYNPGVIMPGITPDWPVNVINAAQPIGIWGFDRTILEVTMGHGWEDYTVATILKAYQALGRDAEVLDMMIFLGDLMETDEDGVDHAIFSVALSGVGVPESNASILVTLLNTIQQEFDHLKGGLGNRLLDEIPSECIPLFHLNRGKVVYYDHDESIRPGTVRYDPESGWSIGVAKAVIDWSWVLRERLPTLKEDGIFNHIPIPRTEQNVGTQTDVF